MTPDQIAAEIDAIIYTARPKEDILRDLARFVQPGDRVNEFRERTGLAFSGFGTAPGVMHYSAMACGLALVADPEDRVHLIRRDERTIDGVIFPKCSLTTNVMTLPSGYSRRYNE